MKKLLTALCLSFVMLLNVAPVQAVGSLSVDEQAIIDALKSGVIANGLKSTDIAAAEAYLSRDGVDITPTQKTTIITNIDNVKSYLKTNNISDLSTLTSTQVQALLKYVEAAAGAVGLTVQLGADNKITITGANGEAIYSSTAVLKNTGITMTQTTLMASSLLIVLLGVGFYAKKKNLFVKHETVTA